MATLKKRDYVIEHPNQKKASSKAARAVVILLLLVSAGLLAIITIGGWDASAGGQIITLAYALIYVLLAFYTLRWRAGVLPLSAALAIIMLIFACVAAPSWFDRDQSGFTDPALSADVLGLLTIIVIPVQALLIIFAMKAFSQKWQVEVERYPDGSSATAGA